MLVQQGEGSCTPTKTHHTPSLEAPSPSHTTHTSPSLPPVTTTSIPTVTPTETTPIRQYTRRARIAQSSALLTVLTASPVFATTTVFTPVIRRKGKEVMVEFETLKKQKVQEQIDAQVAKELDEQLERKDQRRAEQIARDAEIERIHAEEELQIMTSGLDRNNETIAKYLQEYHQFSSELLMERRIELISDLVKYQDNYTKIYKFQSKDKEIFMLVEKDYPIRKGLALVMICYKLQVKNYSQMASDLVLKIYKIASSPSQRSIKFPLAEQLPTASEEICHCKKKSKATARNYTKKMAYVLPMIVAVTEMYNSMYKDSLYYKRSPLVLAYI
nr:hypothetical protein [Tanacetum cinerariifolium]